MVPIIPALVSLFLAILADRQREGQTEEERRRVVRWLHRGFRPSAALLKLFRGHFAEKAILDYLRGPDLEGWRTIRGTLLIPVMQRQRYESEERAKKALSLVTVWQSAVNYGWWRATGKAEMAPFPFGENAEAFPDTWGEYPHPAVLERALLFSFGLPIEVPAADERHLSDLVQATLPEPLQRPGGPIELYYGENDSQVFWESPPADVGIGAMILALKQRPGFWYVAIIEDKSHRTLTTRVDPRSTTEHVTGGATAKQAADAAREIHGLDLVLSTEMHWEWPTRGRHAVLKPGRWSARRIALPKR